MSQTSSDHQVRYICTVNDIASQAGFQNAEATVLFPCLFYMGFVDRVTWMRPTEQSFCIQKAVNIQCKSVLDCTDLAQCKQSKWMWERQTNDSLLIQSAKKKVAYFCILSLIFLPNNAFWLMKE